MMRKKTPSVSDKHKSPVPFWASGSEPQAYLIIVAAML